MVSIKDKYQRVKLNLKQTFFFQYRQVKLFQYRQVKLKMYQNHMKHVLVRFIVY